ncbi:MAG: AAA family ATPase [Betaproteobacteria bacterium RIFCSPLOWO2_02_FULL_67_19]|nr:MAG: AAA family ATPase [Betaproteobacteria bacterium RIFCSPLOWO2_02_FULL_67_19]
MNYVAHFGLREPAFGITPDTSFFFACRSIQEALNTLLVAVANGEGFIKITGEVGTGKTLLCRKFLSSLDDRFVSAYVHNPSIEPRTLLRAICDELRIDVDPSGDQHHVLKEITGALLKFGVSKKQVVLCMDETQAMPFETLETLRLLTNLETEKRKLLQVVLFGQPELDQKLAAESIRQLRQRIMFQYDLKALSAEEVAGYVAHRLTIAGYSGTPLFDRSAMKALWEASGGVPRLVNILAHKSLLLVYGEGGQCAGKRHVEAAVEDTPAAAGLRPWWWPRFAG